MVEARREEIWIGETTEQRHARLSRAVRPTPLNSLMASAQRITKATVKDRRGFGKPEAWQEDAWDMYDLVGEFRFVATTLASKMSQGVLFVGKLNDDPTQPPVPLENDRDIAAEAFSYFGNTQAQRAQMIERMGINLSTPGDGWFVGIPSHMLPESEDSAVHDNTSIPLDDLVWKMLSVSEVSFVEGENVLLRLGPNAKDQISVDPDTVMLIRVWNPHPRRQWLADSAARAALPVLRELVSLTMHISAQTDSRLAGAGILVVPASAKRAIAVASGIDPDAEDDPFTEALMEAMQTALTDRSSAAAVVPLVITVPDESTGLFQHITFSTPLDAEARNLRDEAIRRLALSLDAPPELLLGVGDMNHWGAWLVQEDVVASHIEPPLALICDAITTQYLHPVLIEQGMDPQEAEEYVVWYDVSHLIQRPTRLADAIQLHAVDAISDEALRSAGGFSDEDAPPQVNRAIEIAATVASANPALIDNIPQIVAAFEALFNPVTTNPATIPDAPTEDIQEPTSGTPTEAPTKDTTGGPPADTVDSPASEPGAPSAIAASGAAARTLDDLIDAVHGPGAAAALAAAYADGSIFADTPKDADSDGFIDDGLATERPDPLDAQDFAPATDAERASAKVPKAWTDVEINHAPGARVVARGTDAAGRRQALYSAEHTQAQAAKKFARMRALAPHLPDLDVALKEDDSDTAKALRLIRRMYLRPGSDRDTKSKVKAYGASNLLASHVQHDPTTGNVSLHFTGKKGVDINLPVTDPDLAAMLTQQIEGKEPTDRLFDTDERKVNAMLDEHTGGDFLVKDLRTFGANERALEYMSQVTAPPKTLAEFRKARLNIGRQVSAHLGNTPAMALSSYINPAVFAEWEANLKHGITDPDKGDLTK